MLIVMKADATERDVAEVVRVVTELGLRAHPLPGANRTAIGVTGNQGAVDATRFETMSGVAEAIRVTKPYKLISLDLKPEKTVVRVGDAAIGGEELALIAGRALSRAARRLLRLPKLSGAAARVSFAAARTSRALRPTLFRVSAKRD